MNLKLIWLLTLSIATTSLQAQTTYMWNMEHLKMVKNNLSNYSEAYKPLLRDADKELTKPNPTVVDKPMTPKSGDKHDYMSLGRYWWPNPDTADGLPYIRKDGLSNPELSKFDRERLGAMGHSVARLSLAYFLSDNADYARKAASIIRTWFIDQKTMMNPNMNFGQTIPGHNDGMGRGEGVLDSYSLLSVVDAIGVLSDGGYISSKEMNSLRGWFKEYCKWLTTSDIASQEKNAPNNHGLAYDIQLSTFALFCGDKSLARTTIEQFPSTRLSTQIESDGKQPRELARTTGFGYSVYNLTHMLDMCDLAATQGIDIFNSDNQSIDRAIEYLIPFLGNQASFPYKQIKEWSAVEADFAQVLFRASAYTKAEKYRALYEKFKGANSKDYIFTLLRGK